ncbi:hypothetical protein FB451DRAFT_1183245 [Mycena latifolia]|nr:hypothetical protein FB451DRAFT_1183245 [Mycena latifolia]
MSAYEKSPTAAQPLRDVASIVHLAYDIRSSEKNRLRSKFDNRIMPLVRLLSIIDGKAFIFHFEVGLMVFYRSTWALPLDYLPIISHHSAAFGGLIASGILKIGQYVIACSKSHVLTIGAQIFVSFAVILNLGFPTKTFAPKLIEGLITTVVAISTWLTEEEKILAVGRLDSEYPAVNEEAQHTRKQTIRQGLLKINSRRVLSHCDRDTLPTKTPIEKQLLSVPPYFMAAVVQFISPYMSMRMESRGPFMVFHASVGVIGRAFLPSFFANCVNNQPRTAYAIFVGSQSFHARYAACFLVAAAGPFPFAAFSPALVATNTGPDGARAIALGILSSIGYLGGIVSTWTYVARDAPDYHRGNPLNLAGMATVLICTVATTAHMKWENAQRERGARDYRLDRLSPAEKAQLGHLHPKFRYKI